jgi:tetratricopeptide (TPR) repeat protein
MKLHLFATITLCLLSACGGSSDPRALADAGSKALNSGKYEEAAESFEKALGALGGDTANPLWMQAKLGSIKARTRFDATRAKNEFLELAKASPSKVTDSDYNLIASKLGDAGKIDEAIEILEVGKKAYPESPHLDALGNELVKKASESGESDAIDKLRSLGYVGGD